MNKFVAILLLACIAACGRCEDAPAPAGMSDIESHLKDLTAKAKEKVKEVEALMSTLYNNITKAAEQNQDQFLKSVANALQHSKGILEQVAVNTQEMAKKLNLTPAAPTTP